MMGIKGSTENVYMFRFVSLFLFLGTIKCVSVSIVYRMIQIMMVKTIIKMQFYVSVLDFNTFLFLNKKPFWNT